MMAADLDLDVSELDELSEDDLALLEREVAQLTALWEIKNVWGAHQIAWDDQHVGEKRPQRRALEHPSVDADAVRAFQMKPVVDSLEGNSLWRVINSPVLVVDEDCERARGTWWSFGIEGLSKFREKAVPVWTIGLQATSFVKEDGTWKVLHPSWHRLTKNRYHRSWVHDMIPSNMRPELTPEQDRAAGGKDAYYPDRVRPAVPEPPADDTWEVFPEETDHSWLSVNVVRSAEEEAWSDLATVNRQINTGSDTNAE
jgi:hypothetical protein